MRACARVACALSTSRFAVLYVELYMWLIPFSSSVREKRFTRPCLSVKVLSILKLSLGFDWGALT